MREPSPISDEELCAILKQEEDGAAGFRDGNLAELQAVALDFYNGEPFGDEEEGRSQFVTRDVAEVVDYMTISVLRPFVAGDRVVEFEGVEDAREISAAMQYLFMRKQPGYRVLHDWLKGGLIEKVGVVKATAQTCRKKERRRFEGVGPDDLTALQDSGFKLLESEEVGPELFTVRAEREREYLEFRDYVIPSEEFLFSGESSHEDEADYLAHRSEKTRSKLIEMGFDAETVFGLPSVGVSGLDWRRTNRFKVEGDSLTRGEKADPASQTVLLLEEYIRVDRDGDGIAELLCVHRVENTILQVQEVDEQPFVVFCPFPKPCQMIGDGLSDKTMDIQRLRSVATRQSLDAFYLSNAPRTLVHEDAIGDNTLDDLLTVRPGGVVRWKGPHRPEPYMQPFTADGALKMLEFATGERESRTGITRLNQGLDADALNKTATGTAMMQAQGQQMEDYIARNFGEAFARLMMKRLRLMAGKAEPFSFAMDGKQVEIDPREWPEELDVSIQVGLGTGRKDVRLAYRQQIVAMQAQAYAEGTGLVTAKQLFNSAAGLIADMSLGAVSEYFIDPESEEAQAAAANKPEAQPDPEVMKMQAEQQAKAAELQMRQAEATAKLEAMREKVQLESELAREKAVAELELAREKMAMEMDLAREKMAMEADIAREAARIGAAAKVAASEATVGSYRTGGDLDK